MNPANKTNFHYNLENSLIEDYNYLLKDEEDFWKLKSRIQWIEDGDANTRFFHTSTIKRRRRNKIIALADSAGNWFFEKNEVHNIIYNHFQSIYRTDLPYYSISHTNAPNNTLDDQTACMIDRPLQSIEIHNAISSFKPLKAPGPDDLHLIFFQKFKVDTKEALHSVCMNAFLTKKIDPTLNKTHIILIRKVQFPEQISH